MGGILEYKSPSEFRKMWEAEYQQIFEIAGRIGLRKK
jgi:hypothetical protein